MKKVLFIFFTLSCILTYGFQPQIQVNNTILTKVNGKTISVIDVMKKMDYIFHQNYPQFIHSPEARLQFYQMQWKKILNEMIYMELLLAESETKEIKVSDGEVREEIENRFGPNVILTLDKMGLGYDEALKLIRSEMIVERMKWFFIQSKALLSVTPQIIYQSYLQFCEQNPPKEYWTYQILSFKGTDSKQASQKAYETLLTTKNLSKTIEVLQAEHPDSGYKLSKEFVIEGKDLSSSHKNILSSLEKDQFSSPVCQASRQSDLSVYRIFYLKDFKKIEPERFQAMHQKIKNELIQKAYMEESNRYFEKLKKHYGYNAESDFSDFQPFSIK